MRPEYSYTDWVDSFVNTKAILAGKYILLSIKNVKFSILQPNPSCLRSNRNTFLKVQKYFSVNMLFICTILKHNTMSIKYKKSTQEEGSFTHKCIN
jgi:hypothetical protein